MSRRVFTSLLSFASAPTSALWLLVGLLLAASVVLTVTGKEVYWEGFLAVGTIVGVIRLLSAVFGWKFWPWVWKNPPDPLP